LEPYENIVINDLEELGLELLEYRGSDAIYVFIDRSGNDTEAVNISIDESKEFELVSGGSKKLKDFSPSELDNLFDLDNSIQNNPLQIKVDTIDENGNSVEKRYTVAKIEYG